MNREDLRLYLVTDRSFLNGRQLEDVVMQAVAGGVTMVQLREKHISTQDFVNLALRLKEKLRGTGVPLIINDRVDVALAVDADGVHIGQSDMDYPTARKLLGKEKIIGLSVESFEDIEVANRLDVDYIGVSPVFATPTKTDTAKPFGIDGLREAVKRSVHPTVAIGGMNLANVNEVMNTGTDGVAVVSAIMGADNPKQVAEAFNPIQRKNNHEKICVTYPRVLTIAGSDSGGGAGIQADIKAISATGSYAASAITAVTVQNTIGVQDVFPVPPHIISAQIKAVLSDIGADAIKIGMLHSADVIEAIAEALHDYSGSIVLDPVMVSTSGHRLIEESAIETLQHLLIPMARIITPNLPEAEVLSDEKIVSQKDFPRIARKLSMNGKVSVLLKAGHLEDDELVDILYNAETDNVIELKSHRCESANTHGTGCTLSSALASYLAQGMELDDAAHAAKLYISRAIETGANIKIGHGHGPVNHFFMLH